jgi:hypothetical protein
MLAPVTESQAAASTSLIGLPIQGAAAAPNWNFQHGDCFDRINHAFAWIDHCYQIYKMGQDNSSTRDYWALQHYAYMGNYSPWTLGWGYVRSYRLSGTPAQNWIAASPGSGSNGNCTSITLAVAALGVGLWFPVERCEKWTVTKQNPAVDFKVEWLGPGTRDMRELASEIAVWVNQSSTWPQWVVPADADGGAA